MTEKQVDMLNKVVEVITPRKKAYPGYWPSPRIQQDFSNCPTLAEQHTAHLSDINYLIERYKPDELASYLAARTQYRQEIVGHDFASEPSMQDAKNIIYKSKQEFEALDEDIRKNFRNHLEFLKFIDNPANADKMVKLGILTPKQIQNLQIPDPSLNPQSQTQTPPLTPQTPTPTQNKP